VTQASKKALVLLVEDSQDDAFLFRWELQKSGLDVALYHAWHGREAPELAMEVGRVDLRLRVKMPCLPVSTLSRGGLFGQAVVVLKHARRKLDPKPAATAGF
jgi:hypothetical protein